jgi:hypothetical protein
MAESAMEAPRFICRTVRQNGSSVVGWIIQNGA